MQVRRILASGLAACALFGVGAAMAPAAQAATPLTCQQVNQILARTSNLIDTKIRSSAKHDGQGQHALAARERNVAQYYVARYNQMSNRYNQCGPGWQTIGLAFGKVAVKR